MKGVVKGMGGVPVNGRIVRLRFADQPPVYRTTGYEQAPGEWGFSPLAPNNYHAPFRFLIDIVASENNPTPQSDTVTIDFPGCDTEGQYENIVFEWAR